MALGVSAGLAWKEIFEHISEDELKDLNGLSQYNFGIALMDKLLKDDYSVDEAAALLIRAEVMEAEDTSGAN